jgi:hypothetical protein
MVIERDYNEWKRLYFKSKRIFVFIWEH